MNRITSLAIQSLITILISSGALAVNLQAQTDPGMTVSVPFPFTVGTQSIAPGSYHFRLIFDQFLLSVRNVKTGIEEIFLVQPRDQRGFERRGRLVFGKSEGGRVLNEVHFPGTDSFSEVTRPRRAGMVEAKRSSTAGSVSVGQR